MSSDKYILEDKTPVRIDDTIEWAKRFDKANRVVAQTRLFPSGKENSDGWVKTIEKDGCLVSTVFLGIDHNFFSNGRPLLFETMVFPMGTFNESDMDRYSTYEEAEAGHKAMVEKWKAKLGVKQDEVPQL